jgi:hypothetical protein
VPHLVDDGISILQYADDTIIFMDHDLDKAQNMKLLLCAFEQVSGLKINFHKSELYCFGEAQEATNQYAEMFCCRIGDFPLTYLGIPIDYRKLSNTDRKRVEERFEKRLNSWKGKHLSIRGKLTLINSVLSSLLMYMMSFFAIPRGVLKKLDYFRSRFFWQQEAKQKYRLAKWSIMCQPKDQGGLGIRDLDSQNIALLSKWLYKLLMTDGTWQQLIRNRKSGDSHFWAGLMKVKCELLHFGSFTIKNDAQIRFWEDQWLGTSTMKEQYPCLYHIVRHKQAMIAEVFSSSPLNFTWRRDLTGPKLVAWNEMLSQITNVTLTHEPDEFRWNLLRSGQFSMKSHYLALIHSDVPNLNKRLWKLKVPLKIKIFLWYLRRGVVLTKDNLAKCNWQ